MPETPKMTVREYFQFLGELLDSMRLAGQITGQQMDTMLAQVSRQIQGFEESPVDFISSRISLPYYDDIRRGASYSTDTATWKLDRRVAPSLIAQTKAAQQATGVYRQQLEQQARIQEYQPKWAEYLALRSREQLAANIAQREQYYQQQAEEKQRQEIARLYAQWGLPDPSSTYGKEVYGRWEEHPEQDPRQQFLFKQQQAVEARQRAMGERRGAPISSTPSAREVIYPFMENIPGSPSFKRFVRGQMGEAMEQFDMGAREAWWNALQQPMTPGGMSQNEMIREAMGEITGMGAPPGEVGAMSPLMAQVLGGVLGGYRSALQRQAPGRDPLQTYLQSYPWQEKFLATPRRERGFYPRTFAPPAVWR